MKLSQCRRIARDIQDQIDLGVLAPGDKLPSTAELVRQYNVSTIQVRNAMLMLKVNGVITGVPGVGSFVAGDPPPARHERTPTNRHQTSTARHVRRGPARRRPPAQPS
jgi:GntR family transcriptional regulator